MRVSWGSPIVSLPPCSPNILCHSLLPVSVLDVLALAKYLFSGDIITTLPELSVWCSRLQCSVVFARVIQLRYWYKKKVSYSDNPPAIICSRWIPFFRHFEASQSAYPNWLYKDVDNWCHIFVWVLSLARKSRQKKFCKIQRGEMTSNSHLLKLALLIISQSWTAKHEQCSKFYSSKSLRLEELK